MSEVSLRDVMRACAQGVVVVTAQGADGFRGITVSSFTSVSLEPPLVLICIMNESRAHEAIKSGWFVVNVLGEDQGAVADHFARPSIDSDEQFKEYAFPKLEGCLGYLRCRVVGESAQGDHTVFFGEVDESEVGAGEVSRKGLVFSGRQYWALTDSGYRR